MKPLIACTSVLALLALSFHVDRKLVGVALVSSSALQSQGEHNVFPTISSSVQLTDQAVVDYLTQHQMTGAAEELAEKLLLKKSRGAMPDAKTTATPVEKSIEIITTPVSLDVDVDTATSLSVGTPSISTRTNNYNFYEPTDSELWMYIHTANEGISNWRRSFAQLLLFARSMNATIVEPCVAGGMLRSCNATDPGYKATPPAYLYPLRDIMDMEKVLDIHPRIVPYDDFVRVTKYNDPETHVNRGCFAKFYNKFPFCKDRGLPNYWGGQSDIEPIDNAVKERDSGKHGIVEMVDYWKYALAYYHRPGACGSRKCKRPAEIDDEEALQLKDKLPFPEKVYDDINGMLATLLPDKTPRPETEGGGFNFGAIQFRPETRYIPYIECAQAIIETRDVMAKEHGIPKGNFLLLSPLSARKSLMWDGVNATTHDNGVEIADQALKMLTEAGILRLEQAHTIDDGTLPAIWDMSLASMATAYSTCARGKKCFSAMCRQCNYRGRSATFTLFLRRKRREQLGIFGSKNSTHFCWPEKTAEGGHKDFFAAENGNYADTD